MEKLEKSVDSELSSLVDLKNAKADDILVDSISSALDEWWLTERGDDYHNYIDDIRKHLAATNDAISELLSDIEEKNEQLLELENKLRVLQKEAKDAEIMSQMPPEAAEILAQQIRESLKSELEKGKHRRRVIAVMGSFIWIIVGILLENIVEALFSKDIHQFIIQLFK